MTGPWLAILGINEDGCLSPEAARLVRDAVLVIGGERHLALAGRYLRGERRAWPRPLAGAMPDILGHRGRAVAVLASGDPLWFGIAGLLLRHVDRAEMRIIPALSSFVLAAARLGWALQDVSCLSCCGRPVEAVVPRLHHGARLLVLSADERTPAVIAGLLRAKGFAESTLHVMEALGGPGERVRTVGLGALPDDIGALNLVGIEAAGAAGLALAPGLEDGLFAHDGQITKREMRALTLSALAPRPGELLWDVGCGSGSVGIEWMLRHPSCRAVGIEAQPARAVRARGNALALGVPGLEVVDGFAPGAFEGLAPPDAVFLGGGAQRAGVIDAAYGSLCRGGRLVANAIALRTEAALIEAQARYGGSLLRVGLERLDQVGGMAAYRPAMTVTQWRVER